ncbi:RmlC-like cupin domain-containing protein [Cadophora sp. MPI-SDFR-AT-0126]|nr:RmlC-like cupin domain-containing protein [Leotiomycetes sp. MPI-SDFR-AT-0126]
MPNKRLSYEPLEDKFEKLVLALKDTLGSSGLTSDDVDLQRLTSLMQEYETNEEEWARFALPDLSKAYTRNLVDEGNGKSNLLILVWTPGKGSPIQNHSNAHCLMKILQGELTETRYEFPNHDQEFEKDQAMNVIAETAYGENDVAYMSDDLGVHKMWNRSANLAVSLHLYTPPNIVKKGCYVFEEQTGKETHIKSCEYHSMYGKLITGEHGKPLL